MSTLNSSISGSRSSLIGILLLALLLFQVAPAQEKSKTALTKLDELLLAQENAIFSLPAAVQTGRIKLIRERATELGIVPPSGEKLKSSATVLEEYFKAVQKLESDRNRIIRDIRKRPAYSTLPLSFLNITFQKKALNPDSGGFKQRFDRAFLKEREEADDLDSMREWLTIRNVLKRGEILLVDYDALNSGATIRPEGFDQNYPTYEGAAERILAPLRKFDRELSSGISTLQKKYAAAWFQAYSEIITELTPAQLRSVQAVKVAIESPAFTKLVMDTLREPVPDQPLLEPEDTTEANSATPDSEPRPINTERTYTGIPPQLPVGFPLSDPKGYPPLPTTKCRIVILKLPEAKPVLTTDGYRKVEEEDLTHVVKFGDHMVRSHVLVILENGLCVMYKDDQKVNRTPKETRAVWASNNYNNAPLVWLDEKGQLHGATGNEDLGNFMKGLKDIVYVKHNMGSIFAITRDGKRHFFRETHQKDPNLLLATKDFRSIHSLSFAGNSYINVLRRDGSLDDYNKEKHTRLQPPNSTAYMFGRSLAVLNNRQFTPLGGSQTFVKYLKPDKIPFRIQLSYTYIILQYEKGGPWEIWSKNSNTAWLRMSAYEAAVGDASELRLQGGSFLYALIPSREIPRSGLWELEDLISARELTVNSKPPQATR